MIRTSFRRLCDPPGFFNKSFIKPFLFSNCENEFSFRLLLETKFCNEKSLSLGKKNQIKSKKLSRKTYQPIFRLGT